MRFGKTVSTSIQRPQTRWRNRLWQARSRRHLAILLVACCCGTPGAYAQTNEIEQLKRQLREMQENFERVQREQKQQIDSLMKQLEELTKQQAGEAEKKKLEQELAAQLATNQPPATTAATAQPALSTPWSPAAPITVARAGSAYLNLSFDALMDAGWSTEADPSQFIQLGDHDPVNRGFSLRNAELVLDGAVDPYFKGFANIVLKLDKNDDTSIELEET